MQRIDSFRFNDNSPFLYLSEELVLKIFSYLPKEQIPKVRLTCKTFKRIIEDKTITSAERAALGIFFASISCPFPQKVSGWDLSGMANILSHELAVVELNKLAQVNSEHISFSDTPLVRNCCKKLLFQAWKEQITRRTTSGFFTIPWGTRFSKSSFIEFLRALSQSNQVTRFSFDLELDEGCLEMFSHYLQQRFFPFTTLVLACDLEMSEKHFLLLCQAIGGSRLTGLIVEGFDATLEKARALGKALGSCATLETVTFSSSIAPQDFALLLPFIMDSKIFHEVHFEKCNEGQVALIAETADKLQAETLCLIHCEILDRNAEIMANKLTMNRHIKKLDLSRAGLSQKGVEFFKNSGVDITRIVFPAKVVEVVMGGHSTRVRV